MSKDLEEEEFDENFYEEDNDDYIPNDYGVIENEYADDGYIDSYDNSPAFELPESYGDSLDSGFLHLQSILNTYNAFAYGSEAIFQDQSTISVKIPKTFLPYSLQAAYGFYHPGFALTLTMQLNQNRWDTHPSFLEIKRWDNNPNFPGKVLIVSATKRFFKSDYKPKQFYRSAPYILSVSGDSSPELIELVMKEGFDKLQSKKALHFCNNNVSNALIFLRTGELFNQEFDFSNIPSYKENPLIYLILEVADALLDVQDHCCICGCKLLPGIRPTICNNDLCKFSFINIGVSSSLIEEIRRDPLSADLLITCFLMANGTPFLTPAPDFIDQIEESRLFKIFKSLPSIEEISKLDDYALKAKIGQDAYDLLRWIIFTNRSQFFSLPQNIQLVRSKSAKQFLAFISEPESENIFQQLKKKYGQSIYIWHGSTANRWHSIIRNGLKNATGTHLQQTGAIYGPGIYFGRNSQTSQGYSRSFKNNYEKSKLGSDISIIALCEVVQLPVNTNISETVIVRDPNTGNIREKTLTGALNKYDWGFTLTLEEACIVRYIIVNLDTNLDFLKSPPPKLPTLDDIIKYKSL